MVENRGEIPPLRAPTHSQEANGKKKLARSAGNDGWVNWIQRGACQYTESEWETKSAPRVGYWNEGGFVLTFCRILLGHRQECLCYPDLRR